jgi:hypothetical protein
MRTMSMDPHEIQRFNALVQKVDAIDRKLTFLFQHLGIAYVDARPPPDPVEQLVLAGDRMGALRLLQSKHGLGLAEAKRAVDDIAAKLGV